MNVTESHEMLVRAAEWILDRYGDDRPGEFAKLPAALRIMKPRAQRMRERLDFHRARRAGTPKGPAWASP